MAKKTNSSAKQTEKKQETQPEVKQEVKPETKPEVKPEAKPEVKAETKPEQVPAEQPKEQTGGKKAAPKKEKAAPKKAAAKKQAGGDASPEEVDADGKHHRYFKCFFNDKSFGRYCGQKPKQAANKALTSIIRGNGGNDKCINKTFRFEMVECTRGANKKRSVYEGTRTELSNPLKVVIKSGDGNKTITYKYTNKLKKVKEAPVKQDGGKKKPQKAEPVEKPVEKAVEKPAPKKAAAKKAPSKKAVKA